VGALDTYHSILNVLRALDSCNLLYFYQPPIISRDGDTEMVASPNHQVGAEYNSSNAFATFVQYRQSLRDNSYLAVLRNGALIKCYYAFRRQSLIKHSLLYWPCPLELPVDDIDNETPLGALDLYSNSWENYARFRSPMRFDYDPGNARDGHPASHLHIQSPECRMAIERPFGFATFIRFLFRNFHSEEWAETDIWNDLKDELDKENSCLSDHDLMLQHIAWRRQL
jgi:hypothetical protein